MNGSYTAKQSRHVARVKDQPCGVCGKAPPSAAHHVRQSLHWATIPLCYDCHQGPQGIHGDKTLWRIYKVDEMDVINQTIARLYGE